MSVLDLLANIDWWQLGWLIAGLFMVLFFGLAAATRGGKQKGYDAGYHDRQHWETDSIVKDKLERQ